ncbi:MAG TPA: DUF4397 domain-containing protein [Puia sp.]|jgi:hypothetical protein|nr:DUF4397 domain-containing protein [Puia sp.]
MSRNIRNLCLAVLCLAFFAFTWTGCTKAGSVTNASAVTYLSIIHGAPYSSAANVFLNDTLITPSAIPTGAFSPQYGTRRPGSFAAKFKKAGSDSVFDQLPASTYDTLNFYTLILYNDAYGKAAHALKIFDDYSGVVNNNNAYYRFFNLTPDYPGVNVYFNDNQVQSNRTPADNAVNKGFNSFQSISQGSYIISVKDAATDSVIASTQAFPLQSGNPYTIWITGLRSNKSITINVLQSKY